MAPRNAAKSHFLHSTPQNKGFFAYGSYFLYTEIHKNRFSSHHPGHGTHPWDEVFGILDGIAIISIKSVE